MIDHPAAIRLLGLALMAAGSACDTDPGAPTFPGEFQAVSMEVGGFCPGVDPCFVRMTASANGDLKLDRFKLSRQAPLEPSERTAIRMKVDSRAFREAVASDKRCPQVFDADAILIFETSDDSKRILANGCVFGHDSVFMHPFRHLYDLLLTASKSHFPGDVPE